jgi:enduracididine biosynthesis enzyme MppP
MTLANLTQMEILALDGEVNVSDGHARQSLTDGQQRVVDRFPELFSMAARMSFSELERAAQRSFLDVLGQRRAPVDDGRVMSAYSSSVAMAVLARCLSESLSTVALVHPTFDNIPDILRSQSLDVVPVDEQDLVRGELGAAADAQPECVFITTPNNPTGVVIDAGALERIAGWTRDNGALLALDTSFRGFDRRAQYDAYELLDGVGAEYVIIEDTGKLWPMSELKLGFLAHSARCRLALEEAMSDILLSVSPFVLAVVHELAADAAAGGFDQLHALIARNRAVLTEAIDGARAGTVVDGGRVSVARVALQEGTSAQAAWAELRRNGVDALPCGPFHWANTDDGDRFLRIALARDEPLLQRAAEIIATTLATAPAAALQAGDVDSVAAGRRAS